MNAPVVTVAWNSTYVCDTQRSQVVSLAILASAHPLAGSRATGPSSERRRDVASLLAGTGTTGSSCGGLFVSQTCGGVGGALGADGGHGVLVGTAGSEMLAVTDTTLDGLILKLLLHGVGIGVLGLVLGVALPVGGQAEDNVLAHTGCVHLGALGVLLGQAELGQDLALGDAGVDDLAVRHHADASCGLDLLAVLIVAVCDCCLGAVLVLNGLGRGQLGGGGLIEIVVVGPISAIE